MSPGKNRLLWLAAALVAGGIYLTPYLAVQQLRTAAAARDGAKLARMVDFEALRASLKSGVQARLAGQSREENGLPTPASVMGAAVAGALLGPLVDTLITPESLARLLQGQRPAGGQMSKLPAMPMAERPETRMGYEGPGRFVFSIKKHGDDEEAVELVWHRDGLFGWKLAELRLP